MGHASRVIATPSGLEAATWTTVQRSQFAVWRKARHRSWREIGRTNYLGNKQLHACNPVVTGRLMTGARHATFIVQGCFAGDGMVNADAISSGPRGWGLLAQTGLRLAALPPNDTSRAAGEAVWFNIAFDRGNLLTTQGNAFFGNAGQADFPRLILWHWDGNGFVAAGDSGFTATPSRAPDSHAPQLTGSNCPADGTYQASFGVRLSGSEPRRPNADLDLWVFPRADAYPHRPACEQRVPYNLALSVLAAHTSAPLTSLRRGTITNRQWISAPAWFLLNPDGFYPELFFNVGPTEAYVVPKDLGVNEMWSHLGRPCYFRHGAPHGRPANGTVTFRDGRIVELGVL